ncbi:MAG: toxin ParE1/3/4 [Saprospiraceae bacterium]|jgi:toxin ParE1/3/4
MLKYELSSRAQVDIENIWTYTFENWSRDQANKYFDFIQSEVILICRYPESQRALKLSTRSIGIRRAKSQLIIFNIKNNKVFVIRILHKSMDLEKHLS